MLALSTVTLTPMFQVGCLIASARVAPAISSAFLPRKGPPEAVKINDSHLGASSARLSRHCQIALCSLSTGKMRVPRFLQRSSMTSPPATKVSLFARAIPLPASIAATVGKKPLIPTNALSKRSTLRAASSRAASLPQSTSTPCASSRLAASSSLTATTLGLNSTICL